MPSEGHDSAVERSSGQMRPTAGHICAPFSGFRGHTRQGMDAMVSVDKIEEEEMTREEVMDREFAQPMDEVEILQEWEDYPEERPGENLHIDDGWLIWERDGFEARLESFETTHWRALVTIPDDVGSWLPRPIDLQCRKVPEHGFIKSVETEDYSAREAELILQENFMPTYEVNKFIDDLIEFKEGSEERQQQIEEKLNAASGSED